MDKFCNFNILWFLGLGFIFVMILLFDWDVKLEIFFLFSWVLWLRVIIWLLIFKEKLFFFDEIGGVVIGELGKVEVVVVVL